MKFQLEYTIDNLLYPPKISFFLWVCFGVCRMGISRKNVMFFNISIQTILQNMNNVGSEALPDSVFYLIPFFICLVVEDVKLTFRFSYKCSVGCIVPTFVY